jgi:hypothetical protein
MLRAGPAELERALTDVVALGADGVRAVVVWRDVAPEPRAARRPAGFRPGDPAGYPADRWDRLDDLVRGTAGRGLSLLLSPSPPAPAWASRCTGSIARRQLCRPGGRQYGAFLRALGRRYSGAYPDENQGGGLLPRVVRWSFGNEPNQATWLRPQFARRDGVTYAAAAVTYRAMVRGAIRGLRRSRHGGDEMLLGETSPIGRQAGRLAVRSVPPKTFVRTLLCVGAGGRALRGKAARVTGCRRFARLPVTGFAHHPYARGGSQPPRTRGNPATEITMASIGRLERVLDAAARRGRIRAGLPIHYTENGFQTDPPDRVFGVPLARQGEYLNQSDWMAYRNPRIRSVAQYKLADDAPIASFQSGLRFADGTAKPAWDAYRLPIWVSRRGAARLRVYGQVRPLGNGATGTVALESAPPGGGVFTTVRTVAVRSASNTFVATVPRRAGRWRLRWTPPDGGEPLLSREAVAPT